MPVFHVLSVRRRLGVTVLVVVALGAATALIWTLISGRGSPPRQADAPRARQYAAFTQCLLTDQAGTASPAAAPLWAAMQQASSATAAKSQFLALPAGTPPDAAEGYVKALIGRGCDVILASEGVPGQAAAAVAAANPARHFLLSGAVAPAGNTAVVHDTGVGSAAVARALTDAFSGRFPAGAVLQ